MSRSNIGNLTSKCWDKDIEDSYFSLKKIMKRNKVGGHAINRLLKTGYIINISSSSQEEDFINDLNANEMLIKEEKDRRTLASTEKKKQKEELRLKNEKDMLDYELNRAKEIVNSVKSTKSDIESIIAVSIFEDLSLLSDNFDPLLAYVSFVLDGYNGDITLSFLTGKQKKEFIEMVYKYKEIAL